MMAAGGLVGLLDAIASVAAVAGLDEAERARRLCAAHPPGTGQRRAHGHRPGADRARSLRGDVGTVRATSTVLQRLAPGALPLYVAVARREIAIAERRGELDPRAAARSSACWPSA